MIVMSELLNIIQPVKEYSYTKNVQDFVQFNLLGTSKFRITV